MNDFAPPALAFENDPDDALLLQVDSVGADPLSLTSFVDAFDAHAHISAELGELASVAGAGCGGGQVTTSHTNLRPALLAPAGTSRGVPASPKHPISPAWVAGGKEENR